MTWDEVVALALALPKLQSTHQSTAGMMKRAYKPLALPFAHILHHN
jgi:hypothetical protein